MVALYFFELPAAPLMHADPIMLLRLLATSLMVINQRHVRRTRWSIAYCMFSKETILPVMERAALCSLIGLEAARKNLDTRACEAWVGTGMRKDPGPNFSRDVVHCLTVMSAE